MYQALKSQLLASQGLCWKVSSNLKTGEEDSKGREMAQPSTIDCR